MPAKYLPLREIDFAVKVGFLTKAIWREFFIQGGLRWKQMLWRQLRTEGFFEASPEWPDLYLPNLRHPLVRERTTFLAKAPVISQIGHDELVARTYFILTQALPSVEIKTEALLKREFPLRNKGMRVLDSKKHPDLVVDSKAGKIAIEIELNQKSRSRYVAILRCYRRMGYSKIIYVIRSKATMNSIEEAATEASFPRNQVLLGYGSIGDLRADPKSTLITFDREVQHLIQILKP